MQSKDNACTKEISVFYKVYLKVSLILKGGNRNKKSRENSKNGSFWK